MRNIYSDPVNRRKVWEAINLMKKDRVVVLTTHNMEECDFLADTIMIMHDGHGECLALCFFVGVECECYAVCAVSASLWGPAFFEADIWTRIPGEHGRQARLH